MRARILACMNLLMKVRSSFFASGSGWAAGSDSKILRLRSLIRSGSPTQVVRHLESKQGIGLAVVGQPGWKLGQHIGIGIEISGGMPFFRLQ